MRWSKEELEILNSGYHLYGSNIKINRSKYSIRSKALRLGLSKNKKHSEKLKETKRDFKCSVDIGRFINPDNYSSYILGILLGDGYVSRKRNTISIESIKTDLDEIEHLFDSTGKWNKSTRNRENRKEQRTFHIANKMLHKYFFDFKYTEKSYVSSVVQKSLDENLQHYWWRGYFDADGCICINKKNYTTHISISSSYEQDWKFAEELFIKLGCKYKIERRVSKYKSKSNDFHKNSLIVISRKKDALKFLNYIYQGEVFGLSRKYQKYLEFKKDNSLHDTYM